MAEKTRTTPAEMNQVIIVGETSISSGVAGLVVAFNFFACLSLLDSRDLLFATTLGECGADGRAFSSDSGTSRNIVG